MEDKGSKRKNIENQEADTQIEEKAETNNKNQERETENEEEGIKLKKLKEENTISSRKYLLTIPLEDLKNDKVISECLEIGKPYIPEDKKKPVYISIFFNHTNYSLLTNNILMTSYNHWQMASQNFGKKFPIIVSTPCFFRTPFGYSPQWDDKTRTWGISLRISLNKGESNDPKIAQDYIENFLPKMDEMTAKIVHSNWNLYKINSTPSLESILSMRSFSLIKEPLEPQYPNYMTFKFLSPKDESGQKDLKKSKVAVWTWNGEPNSEATLLTEVMTFENASGYKNEEGEYVEPNPKLNFIPKNSWVRIVGAMPHSISISRKSEVYQKNIALSIIVISDENMQKILAKKEGQQQKTNGPPIETQNWV